MFLNTKVPAWEKFILDDSNRIQKEERYAAGKGIDVSRALTTFGIKNMALGFVGGFEGEEIVGRLINEGIRCDFTKVSGDTRTNIIIISGSLPLGIHTEIYSKIIEIAKNRGSKIILDTDGAALQGGVRMFPDVIKPNVHELSRLAGLELKDIHEIVSTAQTICNQGTGVVLVCLGARGILLVGKKERYLAVSPKVEVVNTIGAGDSSIAGFVHERRFP